MRRETSFLLLIGTLLLTSSVGCGTGINRRLLFRTSDYDTQMGFPADGKPMDVEKLVRDVPELEGRVMTAPQYIEQYDRMVKEKLASGKPVNEFRIPNGVTLSIQLWGEGAPVNYIVGPHGWLDLPYIRKIQVVGRTIEAVQTELEQRYAKIMKNPEVLINVTGSGGFSLSPLGAMQSNTAVSGGDIIVMGAANSRVASNVGYTGKETLISVLGMTGLPRNAEWRQVRIIRRTETDPLRRGVVIFCDLWNYFYFADVTQDIPLMPGDVIYIPLKQSTGDEFMRQWGIIKGLMSDTVTTDGFIKFIQSK